MNALEIDKALAALMDEKWKESQAKLSFLPKEAKNERKAVQIEIGMFSLFLRFGLLFYVKNGNTYEERRNHVLWIREKLIFRENLFAAFPKIKKAYDNADEAEKKCIIAAFQGEMFMRHCFYDRYIKDLEAAKKYNNIEEAFELGIKVSVLEEGFRIWEAYRQENGIYSGMFDKELN